MAPLYLQYRRTCLLATSLTLDERFRQSNSLRCDHHPFRIHRPAGIPTTPCPSLLCSPETPNRLLDRKGGPSPSSRLRRRLNYSSALSNMPARHQASTAAPRVMDRPSCQAGLRLLQTTWTNLPCRAEHLHRSHHRLLHISSTSRDPDIPPRRQSPTYLITAPPLRTDTAPVIIPLLLKHLRRVPWHRHTRNLHRKSVSHPLSTTT